MKLLSAILILVIIAVACGKDKFTTEPQVEARSISPETVFQGDVITFRSKFTDQEGDLDSVLIVYKWYNGAASTYVDTSRETLAAHNLPPKIKDGDLILHYEYNRNTTGYPDLPRKPTARDTTATLGLILIDKENHRSNYTESDKIRLTKQ